MMTDLTLAKETRLFLLSIVVGVGLSLLYDLLRVLRLQTRHRPIVVSLEDLFYFLVCAAVTFGFALKDNSGQIRGYILIGELLGWGCWHLTVFIPPSCAAAGWCWRWRALPFFRFTAFGSSY